jgi:hypothetical protein
LKRRSSDLLDSIYNGREAIGDQKNALLAAGKQVYGRGLQ